MNFNLPTRPTDAHKGDFGRVLLLGGSRGMAGSIALSSIAALKTGSGLVSAAVPDHVLETVAAFHPGIMTIPLSDTPEGQFDLEARLEDLARYDAIGCGPGMRTGDGSVRLVERLMHRTDLFRVLDADAINILAQHRFLESPALPRDQSRLVLTPHPGELARLTGIPSKDRSAQIDGACELAESWGVTVVVKGGPTVVVGRSSGSHTIEQSINPSGNPGMATAGSGDVLTGIIASFLGQKQAPFEAARNGVYLHGVAGDIASDQFSQAGMTCNEILQCLPNALNLLSASSR